MARHDVRVQIPAWLHPRGRMVTRMVALSLPSAVNNAAGVLIPLVDSLLYMYGVVNGSCRYTYKPSTFRHLY